MKKILKISFTIIGSIIGAGFASGKEIYLFFLNFGEYGKIGIILSFVLIGMVIYKTIKISSYKNIGNYEEFLEVIGSKNGVIKAIINIFLLMSFYIMISAFSAYFEQELGIPRIVGTIIIVLFCYITLNKNINGIIKINTILIPILIFLIILFGIKNISLENNIKIINQENSLKYIFSAVIYASYNSITLIPILVTITKQIKNKKENIISSIVIVITLICLAFSIYITISKIPRNIDEIELPTIYMAGKQGEMQKYIYGAVILTSIFTTAITTLYSFLQNNFKEKNKYKKYNLIFCLAGLIVYNLSFTALLNKIYPIFGLLGLIQIYRIFAITLEKNPQN